MRETQLWIVFLAKVSGETSGPFYVACDTLAEAVKQSEAKWNTLVRSVEADKERIYIPQ
jgi:hypothetical protein